MPLLIVALIGAGFLFYGLTVFVGRLDVDIEFGSTRPRSIPDVVADRAGPFSRPRIHQR
jgi:hypothetical protein